MWFVVGTVCVGAIMGQFDASIAQLVLPTLEATFQARLGLVDWVALAYLFTLDAALPIFGRLAAMIGRKLLYTGGFVLFVAGSALCGLTPSLVTLIGARLSGPRAGPLASQQRCHRHDRRWTGATGPRHWPAGRGAGHRTLPRPHLGYQPRGCCGDGRVRVAPLRAGRACHQHGAGSRTSVLVDVRDTLLLFAALALVAARISLVRGAAPATRR